MKRARRLNETFKEHSDPLKDMGIGLYKKRVLVETSDEALNVIITLLPQILGKSKIPKDIIYSKTAWIREIYARKLYGYVIEHISIIVKEGETVVANPYRLDHDKFKRLSEMLYEMGFDYPNSDKINRYK